MPPHANHLIGCLPAAQRQHLLDTYETVSLATAQVVCVAGERARCAYFMMAGSVSLVGCTASGACMEVAMVGSEGMIGAQMALGSAVSWMGGTVQQAGSALCISAAALRLEVAASTALQCVLHSYVDGVVAQLTTNAVCAHFHEIGPRLARWLLMSQDREQSDTVAATQAGMGHLLGVRRVGITAAAGQLQRSGLIRYTRGALTIVDRAGLQAVACSCYAPLPLRA